MARGGYRPGSGRPKGSKKSLQKQIEEGMKSHEEETGEKLTPLEYMLKVVNDPNVDDERRDRMAIAAAPFVHARPRQAGKAEVEKQKAEEATKKFAPLVPMQRVK